MRSQFVPTQPVPAKTGWELLLFWTVIFAPVAIVVGSGIVLYLKRVMISAFVERKLWRRRAGGIQLPPDLNEEPQRFIITVPYLLLLAGTILNIGNIVAACFGVGAVMIDTGYEERWKWMPFGLSWLLVVPTLWLINVVLIAHTIGYSWLARHGPVPTRAYELGANAQELSILLVLLPLITYLISLPYLHPFHLGWWTDVLVAVILPVIGASLFAWGSIIKWRYGDRLIQDARVDHAVITGSSAP
ncbi:hypothetical protein BKA62DRAFT_699179 [Auriculariales sp. MPI-PUGE-AT-0066]|nr:hypothetical protein BKA62DRAFT_699179 [Auriculariales sp. MPI-PUGE-AT-0066]